MPRVSSDDEPSTSAENEMRFLTSGPAVNAFMRTSVPAFEPRATALCADSPLGRTLRPGVAAPAIDARPRRDLDAALPDLVELRGVGVAAHDDARDLIARRQAAAGEPVDANRRARAGNLLEHALQFVGIVGQLIDLGLAQASRVRPPVSSCVADTVTSVVDVGDGHRHGDLMGRRRAAGW